MNDQNHSIEQAKAALKAGETILYPTDTIWGLGCDATNEVACQKIMDLKNRPAEKSFVLLVDGFQMIEKYIPEFAEVCYELADLSEKPLTIIYPDAQKLAPSVIAQDGSVGIRITKDPICLQLIRSLKTPIVSTSANLSGEAFPTCFDEIHATIKEKVACIVTERLTEKCSTPSQIIKIGKDSSIKIIRL
jgi:L-threonylcarbamoyladenylate synthase